MPLRPWCQHLQGTDGRHGHQRRLTSIGGTIYAQYLLYIDPDSTFGVVNSVEIMLRAYHRGPGTILGPLLGSVVLTPLSEITRLAFQSYSGVYLMIYGLILWP